MNLQEVQREITARAVVLSIEESTGKLKYKAPQGAMSTALAQAIKEHRLTLIENLAPVPEQEAAAPAPSTEHQEEKRIECVNGIRMFVGYSDTEYKAFIYEEARQQRQAKPLAAYWTNTPSTTPERQAAAPVVASEKSTRLPTSNQERQAAPPAGAPVPEQEDTTPAPRAKGKGRAIVYADIRQGQAITDSGASITFPADCSLSGLLQAIQEAHTCDRLYVCGELPDNYEAWLVDAGMWEEHTTAKRGHYFDKEKASNHVARYQHRATGAEIEIRTIHSWFGDCGYTVEQARAAMRLLNQYLASTFTPDTIAYATPALTFQQIWQRENRIAGKKFTPLSQEIRDSIHSSSGQGRIELTTPESASTISGLYYYDGIFMYSALTWGMPTEEDTHDNINLYAGKKPARYRICYTIPQNWQHIGLFMTPKEQVTSDWRDNGAWLYPGEKYQGLTFETWADGSELDVLIDHYAPAPVYPPNATKEQIKVAKELAYQEGTALALSAWNITILERIVFKNEKDSTEKKPLDTITNKLAKMRDKVERDMQEDSTREVLYKLVRDAIRNILLHGIGSFHRTNRDVTYILRTEEPAPDDYTHVRPLGENHFIYTVPQKTEAYTQQFEHPEWTALIWARCRARMTRAALSLARETIIAIRTDAIATTTEQSQWNASEKRGTLRQKWAIHKTMKAPHTFEALDALVSKHVKGDR